MATPLYNLPPAPDAPANGALVENIVWLWQAY